MQHAVGADGSAQSVGEAAVAEASSSAAAVTIEGRWAYFPVFTSIGPAPGERGRRGAQEYKGHAVPLVVADVASTMQEGLTLAREALGSGAVLSTLERLAEVSHRPA